MNNLKIGAVSGLIAGFVAGIVTISINMPIVFKLGLPFWYFLPPQITSFTKIAANEMINNLIWGTILGVIYSRVTGVIPGKAFLKGLLFGLFGYLIYNIYFAVIFVPYWLLDVVAALIINGPLNWIAYGLVLGTLYKFLRDRYYLPKKEPKIIEYDMKSGILPGTIAGFLSGAGTFFTIFICVYTGLWAIYPRHLIDFAFIIGQFGSQIMIHLIPGIYLGAIYPKVYNLVPGKGILKGLCYGLIVSFLINELRWVAMDLGYGNFPMVITVLFTGSIAGIVYGLVLGYLYKK